MSAGHVFGELLWLKPQGDFLLSGFDGIGSVADVTPDLNAVVAADGTGLGVLGVGLAKHYAASLDDASSLPHHGHDGSGSHVLDESREERLGGQVGVVLLQKLFISLKKAIQTVIVMVIDRRLECNFKFQGGHIKTHK